MSTTTNGAATEAAIKVLTGTATAAGKVVVNTASAVGPAVGTAAEAAGKRVNEAGHSWLDASKSIAGLSLDAYDASIRAYLDFTTRVVAAGRADWAIELAENNAKALTDLASNYSTAARDILGK